VGKPLVKVPFYSMVNLIAEKPLVAELIQHDMTPGRLAAETARLLDNPAERERMKEELARVAARLSGPGDAIARAADEVDRILSRSNSSKPVLEVSQ
jgi:lipid-A-disaccharide synthase